MVHLLKLVSAVACKKMPDEGKEIRKFGATVLCYVLFMIIIRTTE